MLALPGLYGDNKASSLFSCFSGFSFNYNSICPLYFIATASPKIFPNFKRKTIKIIKARKARKARRARITTTTTIAAITPKWVVDCELKAQRRALREKCRRV